MEFSNVLSNFPHFWYNFNNWCNIQHQHVLRINLLVKHIIVMNFVLLAQLMYRIDKYINILVLLLTFKYKKGLFCGENILCNIILWQIHGISLTNRLKLLQPSLGRAVLFSWSWSSPFLRIRGRWLKNNTK